MDKASEIQLKKSVLQKILSKNESAFILKILNHVGSFQLTLTALESYSCISKTSLVIVPGFTLKQHSELSASILTKLKKVQLDQEDIDTILTME